jgi:F-type H+-transporting ATPase subunit epsilon
MAEHESFECEVLTPEGEVFKGEVQRISTRTGTGSIGILARHQPLLGKLEANELKLYKTESDVERFAQGEGFLQVTHEGRVMLLVDELRHVDDLDVSEIRDRLQRAEDELSASEEESETHRSAKRAKRRYETFLEISEGGRKG